MENLFIDKIRSIMGKFSFKVWKGHGSFLTFEFGTPNIEFFETKKPENAGRFKNIFPFNKFIQRRVFLKGEWFLWIYCTNWKIYVSDILIAHCESKNKTIENATYFLEGQKIIKVEVNKNPTTTIFYFDLNTKLECFNENYDNETESWFIYDNLSEVLTFRQDGKFNISKINSHVDQEEEWFEINEKGLILEI